MIRPHRHPHDHRALWLGILGVGLIMLGFTSALATGRLPLQLTTVLAGMCLVIAAFWHRPPRHLPQVTPQQAPVQGRAARARK